jgi:hypothetical protein
MSWARVLAAALVTAGLSACSDVRTLNYGAPYQPATARSYLAWAGAAGPVLVELRGNPFQGSDQAVAGAIADEVTGSVAGLPVRFTANPAEAAHPDWRVVYDFSAEPSKASATVCAEAGPTRPARNGGQVTALLVFCNEAKPIIAAALWAKPVAGPGAEGFRELAQHGMRDLFVPESMGADPAVDYPD